MKKMAFSEMAFSECQGKCEKVVAKHLPKYLAWQKDADKASTKNKECTTKVLTAKEEARKAKKYATLAKKNVAYQKKHSGPNLVAWQEYAAKTAKRVEETAKALEATEAACEPVYAASSKVFQKGRHYCSEERL